MLALRPNCECCDKDLPPAAADAMICTFECTFCRDCVETKLGALARTAAAIWWRGRSGRPTSSRNTHRRPSAYSNHTVAAALCSWT